MITSKEMLQRLPTALAKVKFTKLNPSKKSQQKKLVKKCIKIK